MWLLKPLFRWLLQTPNGVANPFKTLFWWLLQILDWLDILIYIYLPTFILKSLKECKLMSASFFFIAIAKSAIITIWLRVANFSYMKGKIPDKPINSLWYRSSLEALSIRMQKVLKNETFCLRFRQNACPHVNVFQSFSPVHTNTPNDENTIVAWHRACAVLCMTSPY